MCVCEMVICCFFIGWCIIFSIVCLNFGSLFRNKMLLWVRLILFGFGWELLFINVILLMVWCGVWKGCCVMSVDFCGKELVIEWILVVLSVLWRLSGGRMLGNLCVSMVLFVFGGLMRMMLWLLVVVILSVCLMFFCLCIFEKLVLYWFICVVNLLCVFMKVGFKLSWLFRKCVVFCKLFIL